MNKVFPSANGVTAGDSLTYDPTAPDEVRWATVSGGGSGDSITVNTTAATNANFNDSSPAAPAGDLNVIWQIDTGATPDNVSAYVNLDATSLEVSGGAARRAALTGDVTAAAGSNSVTVDQARGLRETGGPTTLTMASVADGEALYRTGSTVDGVTFAVIAASVIQSSVVTAVGYTTVNLPSCRFVTFTVVGAGGYGNDGVTGSNAANRAGGRGGGGAALTVIRCRRDQLPDSVEAYVASTVSAASPNQTFSCIEFANSSLTAGGLATTLPNFSNLLAYALSGISSSGAGGGAASDASCIGLRIHSFRTLGGRASDAAATNNQPPDLTPFGASGTAPYSPGCSGAGKNTVPTAFIGGGFATAGNFGAVGGGTNPGGKGADASYYGGEGTWTTAANSVSELAVGYGGCGGGSHTAGTGGAGGVGSPGCGGGGGGAGTTGTASGAAGGNGFIIIECE